MPNTIFTAIDPNGTVHKRTTAHRSYTHTVVARWSYDHELRAASNPEWATVDQQNYRYFVAESDPVTAKYAITEEKRASYRERIEGYSEADYVAKMQAERIAKVEAEKAAGAYDEYRNLGWCGRLDLAVRLKDQTESKAAYRDVTMLDAVKVEKKEKA